MENRSEILDDAADKIERDIWSSGPTSSMYAKLQDLESQLEQLHRQLGIDQLDSDLLSAQAAATEGAAGILAKDYSEFKELNDMINNQIFNNTEVQGLQKKLQSAQVALNSVIAKNLKGIQEKAIEIYKKTVQERADFAPTLNNEQAAQNSYQDQYNEKMQSDPVKAAKINNLYEEIAKLTAQMYSYWGSNPDALAKIQEYKNNKRRLDLLRNGIKNIQSYMFIRPSDFFEFSDQGKTMKDKAFGNFK